MSGIDGRSELAAELDRLSGASTLANAAPRGTGLSGFLASGIDAEGGDGDFWRLTVHLMARLSIWWPPSGYRVLPVMTPWCIRDRLARYQHGPEMWGAPRDDGYLRDDNSIIKKLPLPLYIDAPETSPYRGRKPWRGFTACHIWRDLADGIVGGADPWIYSNMANLMWLPSPLAPLTDYHPRVQALLQRTSQRLFRGHVAAATRPYTEYAWAKLTPHGARSAGGPVLDVGALAFFHTNQAFFDRRLAYIDAFVDGVDRVRRGLPLDRRLICSRYTTWMPFLDPVTLGEFRTALDDYRTAVRRGL